MPAFCTLLLQRLAAKRHECANLLLADMSLSGASQLSFAVALEKAEKQDPAAAALRRCYRCAFWPAQWLSGTAAEEAGFEKDMNETVLQDSARVKVEQAALAGRSLPI